MNKMQEEGADAEKKQWDLAMNSKYLRFANNFFLSVATAVRLANFSELPRIKCGE